jgi:hypothetical protein
MLRNILVKRTGVCHIIQPRQGEKYQGKNRRLIFQELPFFSRYTIVKAIIQYLVDYLPQPTGAGEF